MVTDFTLSIVIHLWVNEGITKDLFLYYLANLAIMQVMMMELVDGYGVYCDGVPPTMIYNIFILMKSLS